MYHVAVAILHHIPEGMLIIAVGLLVLGARRPFRTVALLGLIYGTALTVFRVLMPGGAHVPAIVVTCYLLNLLGARVTWKQAAYATLSTIALVAAGSVLISVPIMYGTGLDVTAVTTTWWLSVPFAWLEDVLLLTLGGLLFWRLRQKEAANA